MKTKNVRNHKLEQNFKLMTKEREKILAQNYTLVETLDRVLALYTKYEIH